jgi:hypothetical protein
MTNIENTPALRGEIIPPGSEGWEVNDPKGVITVTLRNAVGRQIEAEVSTARVALAIYRTFDEEGAFKHKQVVKTLKGMSLTGKRKTQAVSTFNGWCTEFSSEYRDAMLENGRLPKKAADRSMEEQITYERNRLVYMKVRATLERALTAASYWADTFASEPEIQGNNKIQIVDPKTSKPATYSWSKLLADANKARGKGQRVRDTAEDDTPSDTGLADAKLADLLTEVINRAAKIEDLSSEPTDIVNLWKRLAGFVVPVIFEDDDEHAELDAAIAAAAAGE